MKFRSLGAELFLEDLGSDGLTEMTKLVVAFRNFANASYNGVYRVKVTVRSVVTFILFVVLLLLLLYFHSNCSIPSFGIIDVLAHHFRNCGAQVNF